MLPSHTHAAASNNNQSPQFTQSQFMPNTLDSRQFVAMFAMALRDPVVQALYREVGIADTAARAELKACRSELAQLKDDYKNLYQELEELKQYQRRNALRVLNPNWPENDEEDTDELILSLCREFEIPVRAEDISRSHRVGKKTSDRPRAILVKLIGYRPRERLFKAKRDIRKKYPSIQINKDLTQATNELAYLARCEKRAKNIKDTWVIDGKVFAKAHQYSNPEIVKNNDHLSFICSNVPTHIPTFAEVVPQRPTSENAPGPCSGAITQSTTSNVSTTTTTHGGQSQVSTQPHVAEFTPVRGSQELMLSQPPVQPFMIPGSAYLPREMPPGATSITYELNTALEPPVTSLINHVQQQQLSAQYAAALHLAPNYSLPPPWTYPASSLPRYGEPSTEQSADQWIKSNFPFD